MNIRALIIRSAFALFLACVMTCGVVTLRAQELGNHTSLWFGNTGKTGGDGAGKTGGDGAGKTGGDGAGLTGYDRLQLNVLAMDVAPDGKVFTNSTWDEAHVLTGVYKDGRGFGDLQNDWNQADGGSVAAHSSYVFISVYDNGKVRRYNASDFKQNGADITASTQKITGMTVDGNELFVSDTPGRKIKVYNVSTLAFIREFAFSNPSVLTADGSGYLWILDKGSKKVRKFSKTGAFQNVVITFAANVIPADISYNAVTNRLMVADGGSDHNVKFYNPSGISGAPTTPSGTLGATGGMYSGRRGAAGALRFAFLNGVGADSSGNIYISQSRSVYFGYQGGHTVIESYTPSGALRWSMNDLAWIETALPDPANENNVYTLRHRYAMDYSKAPGKEGALAGITLDKATFPQDVREYGEDAVRGDKVTILDIKRLGGKLFLFGTDMGAFNFVIYRFNEATNGEIAIPSMHIAKSHYNSSTFPPNQPASGEWIWRDANGNGRFDAGEYATNGGANAPGDAWGWCVDDTGDIWLASYTGGIRKYDYQGLDSIGNPIYDFNHIQSYAMPPAYPIKVSANGRYFVDQRDQPFLYHACTAWQLFSKLTKAETEQYLENRRQKGFNTIQATLLPWEADWKNRDGHAPFLAQGDLTRPNEAYFQHVDWVIRRAEEKGLQLVINPLWIRQDSWRPRLTNANAEKYGRFLGGRYRNFDNIVWFHGGDMNPLDKIDEIRQSAAGIKAIGPKHLQSYHAGRGADGSSTSSSQLFHNEGWLNFNFGYCYGPQDVSRIDPFNYVQHVRDYNLKPTKPFILAESYYERERNKTGADRIRRQGYWTILSGGTGHAYGNFPIYAFADGWQSALEDPGARHLAHLYNLFASHDWHKLVPDQDHMVVVDGYGVFGAANYVTAAHATDGTLIMAYIPPTGTGARTITVDMSKLRGRATARWFNPTNGKYTPIGTYANSGSQQFKTPGDNGDKQNDWVLVLESSEGRL